RPSSRQFVEQASLPAQGQAEIPAPQSQRLRPRDPMETGKMPVLRYKGSRNPTIPWLKKGSSHLTLMRMTSHTCKGQRTVSILTTNASAPFSCQRLP
ncbi:hypothetical protein, partial [Pontiella sp.]|uniref:hypothetical protein n=1 Tax=Pontiella sp. TaxID=2837462 RepID=UPI003567DD17